jgi:DNA gyrase subunit A
LLAVRDFSEHEDSFLFFATRLGRVKRTPLREYANIRANGLRAVVINEGDNLLSVRLTDGATHVFMGTNRGMAIRFEETDVRSMGRVTAGVRGVNLRKGDFVEEFAAFDPAEENDILVVTDLGYGKRTRISEFRLQRRGGYGIKLIQLTKKNGVVAAIRYVQEEDEILIVTEGGMLIRTNVVEISRFGRAAQGVRVIRLNEGDRVVSVARAEAAEDDDEDRDIEEAVDGAEDPPPEEPGD